MNNDDTFNPNTDDNLPPELEARVVAWVLGEASAFEAAELTRLCAEQPELAVFKRRIEAINGLVRTAARPPVRPLVLSPERRAKVLAVIGDPEAGPVATSRAKARKDNGWMGWRAWALPAAACLTVMLILAGVLIPTVGAVRMSSHKAAFQVDVSQREQLAMLERTENESPQIEYRSQLAPGEPMSFGNVQLEEPSSSLAARGAAALKGVADTTVSFSMEIPESSSSSLSATGLGAGMGGFNDASRRDGVINDASYLRGPAPAPVPAPAKPVAAPKPAQPIVPGHLDYKVESDNLYAGPPVSMDEMRLPQSYGKVTSGVSITAGTPQDFVSTGIPVGSRQLSESEKAAFFDRLDGDSLNMPVADGYAYADSYTVSGGSLDSSKMNPSGDSEVGTESALSVTLDTQYVTDYVFRSSNGLSSGQTGDPFAPAPVVVDAPTKKKQTITITAGTPQELREFTKSEQGEIRARLDQRKVEHLRDANMAGGSTLKNKDQKSGTKTVTLQNGTTIQIPTGFEDVMDYAAVVREMDERKQKEGEGSDQIRQAPPVDESLRAETVTSAQAVSTFSLHVSDASFRIGQAALARGELPDASTVRPEEFYNAFDYGDAAPVAGEPVACRIEQAAHPFLQQRNLVRIAMKVPAAGRSASQPLRLTVLLDTSGSMEREDRAATVRAALGSLAGLLGPADRVTLIGFARTPRLLAVNVSGDRAAQLVEIAAQTPAEGGTNLEEALELAGQQARRLMAPNAQNRIVLLTDGAANLGNADPQRLSERIEAFRHEGIAFDACGVVADGLDDGVLEALTRKGDGRYAVINAPDEADANFARTLAGAFRPAAKDVKVQVRFNPARVASYRLIGFEQHRLRTEDFRNNAIDAAELAAEEAANALYQVAVLPEGEGELGEVFVRFLDPSTGFYVERSWTLTYDAQAPAFTKAAPSLQLAGSAAFLAEKLRGGELAGQVRLDEFAPVVNGLGAAYPGAKRVQDFMEMFRQTRRVLGE